MAPILHSSPVLSFRSHSPIPPNSGLGLLAWLDIYHHSRLDFSLGQQPGWRFSIESDGEGPTFRAFPRRPFLISDPKRRNPLFRRAPVRMGGPMARLKDGDEAVYGDAGAGGRGDGGGEHKAGDAADESAVAAAAAAAAAEVAEVATVVDMLSAVERGDAAHLLAVLTDPEAKAGPLVCRPLALNGQSLLHLACAVHPTEVDVTGTLNGGEAAAGGIVSAVLGAGGRPMQRDVSGKTALHIAAAAPFLEGVRLLLAAAHDAPDKVNLANAVDRQHRTPMHAALYEIIALDDRTKSSSTKSSSSSGGGGGGGAHEAAQAARRRRVSLHTAHSIYTEREREREREREAKEESKRGGHAQIHTHARPLSPLRTVILRPCNPFYPIRASHPRPGVTW